MKKLNIFIIAGLIIASAALGLYAAGVTSTEFLLIGVGARAQGLSGAYTALSDDVNGIYWNQAALGLAVKKEVSVMYNALYENMGYNYAAFGIPTKAGTFALSFHYLDMGTFEGRQNQISSAYSFGADDTMVALGYGKRLFGGTYGGFSLKYIKEHIEDISAQGVAADFGIIQQIAASPLRIGFSVHNIGAKIKFVEESENLPLNAALGIGYSVGGFTFGVDVKHFVYDNVTDLSIGAELMPLGIVTLRGGMFCNMARPGSLSQTQTNSQILNPSGGIGIKIKGTQFDYAITPFNQLGTTHKISLGYQF
jgi:hypothetical protein